MRLARVYPCTRSSWMVVRYHGMMVSGMVGSVDAELERRAAIASAGIRLFNGQQRAVQHQAAESFVGMVLDGAEEADAHFVHFLRLEGDPVARAAVVFHLLLIELVVGHGEL